MPDYVFTDKSNPPDSASLSAALGGAYPFYQAFLELAGGFIQNWHYYKSGGWVLKVTDGGKALFYLIPFSRTFKISLTVRENERTTLMGNDIVRFAWADLEIAKKYPEGYALQYFVGDAAAASDSLALVGEIIRLRARPSAR